MDAVIEEALARLAGKGIRATAAQSGEALVVNVHDTALSDPGTWAGGVHRVPADQLLRQDPLGKLSRSR